MLNKKNFKTSEIDNVLQTNNNTKKSKVDINILLNRIRVGEKKKKYESIFFISLVSLIIISAGLFFSFWKINNINSRTSY